VLEVLSRTPLARDICFGYYLFNALVVLYPRMVGGFAPAAAEYVVFVETYFLARPSRLRPYLSRGLHSVAQYRPPFPLQHARSPGGQSAPSIGRGGRGAGAPSAAAPASAPPPASGGASSAGASRAGDAGSGLGVDRAEGGWPLTHVPGRDEHTPLTHSPSSHCESRAQGLGTQPLNVRETRPGSQRKFGGHTEASDVHGRGSSAAQPRPPQTARSRHARPCPVRWQSSSDPHDTPGAPPH
jgi:hypothetical protein